MPSATSPDQPHDFTDRPDVVLVGNAIVDRFAFVEHGVPETLGLRQGTMNLVDLHGAERIGSALSGGEQVSGGSAANTAAGVASLGGSAVFVGSVGPDELGGSYAADLEQAGVHCVIDAHGLRAVAGDDGAGGDGAGPLGTGRCLALITPDADRTMATYLGAANVLGTATVERAGIERARSIYLEGYLFDAPTAAEALKEAQLLAHAAGVPVAITLSDPFLVERHHDAFAELVASTVDILFCNETELCMLTGAADVDAAVERVSRPGLVAFVTRGVNGTVVVSGDERVEVPAAEVADVVDTTGAGDLYAAGALFGLVRGASLERSAALGALAAGEVISHIGARPLASLAALAAEGNLLPA